MMQNPAEKAGFLRVGRKSKDENSSVRMTERIDAREYAEGLPQNGKKILSESIFAGNGVISYSPPMARNTNPCSSYFLLFRFSGIRRGCRRLVTKVLYGILLAF